MESTLQFFLHKLFVVLLPKVCTYTGSDMSTLLHLIFWLPLSPKIKCAYIGWSSFSNTWELGASCNDGKGARASSSAHGCESWVRFWLLLILLIVYVISSNRTKFICLTFCSRRAEKYFRRGARLDWPERATSSESMRAVWKLPRLPVIPESKLYSEGAKVFVSNPVRIFMRPCCEC